MSYYIIFFVGLGLSLLAQILVQASFSRYSKKAARSGYTGFTTARRLLDEKGLSAVRVERVAGHLTDHFSPRENIMRLSDSTYGSASIAAIGVAAHETGHAVQHKENFLPNKIRSALLLPANLGSQAGPLLAIFGLMMQSSMGDMLLQIGIILFGASVLFFLVTLPVEFDASRRALAMIRETGVLTSEELKGARSVLRAAALTYVASALTAVLYLLRYIGLANSRRRR